MKLENALKQFHPKSPTFSDSSNSTAPDRLKGMDSAAAMGMASQKAAFGMHAFFGKNDVSIEDKITTVKALTQYAMKTAPKLVAKAAGNRIAQCMTILATMAFEDYARSAGSVCQCQDCGGKGLIYRRKDVVKHPGITNMEGIEIVEPIIRNELVGELCMTCNGKGQSTYRCQCRGRGKVPDEKQTLLQGVPVIKNCPRCSGRGYRRVPSSVAYNAIKHLVPDLTQSTWSRNWKPFYEKLTGKCYIEESTAEVLFTQITR
ncbi:antitermination protein [Morganella psychrotolerans]|uniref:Molecular chaperone n=1 Tax=Morganella psychrotolerans TaxID=368603 RepID=A0A1B8HU82_9GAMM|nr:antitermination protein [Morganella psychrotolerans]OBU13331.1 molecular chaperone [Morganella psychrotolerans]